MSDLVEKIERHIEKMVNNLGYSIVKVSIFGGYKQKVLQIMIERNDNVPVTVEDCEKVSKLVAPAIDIMNPIKSHYNLEISSAGINRPLVKPKDFMRFIGKNVIIKTYGIREDRKVFKGVLDLADESGIKLKLEEPNNEILDLVYSDIKYAHIDDGDKEIEQGEM